MLLTVPDLSRKRYPDGFNEVDRQCKVKSEQCKVQSEEKHSSFILHFALFI